MKFNKPAPLELIRWNLAERFGWTLDYIDHLSIMDIWELGQVDQGRAKANEKPGGVK